MSPMSLPAHPTADTPESVLAAWPAPADWITLSLQWPLMGWIDGLRWSLNWWSTVWPVWEVGSATAPFAWAVGVAAEPARASGQVSAAEVVEPAAAPMAAVLTLPRAPRAALGKAASVTTADDLTRLEGVGPKIAQKLADAGFRTFSDLAAAPVDRLQSLLAEAGPRFKLARADTWPEQAALLAAGDEAGFAALTDALRGGRRV